MLSDSVITAGHEVDGEGWSKAWPLVHPPDYRDPESGMMWSRDEQTLLLRRATLLSEAQKSRAVQREILERCRRSFAFWADHFAWSIHDQTWDATGKLVGTEGTQKVKPWFGWPINDVLHAAFWFAIKNNRKMLVPKSREMRATWHFLLENVHLYLFKFNERALMIAEKADKVDGPLPDTLFQRMRFVIENVPDWMKPPQWDKKAYNQWGSLKNPLTGSAIEGDSTTENIGRGQRPIFIEADEADFNDSLRPIIAGTNNATRCLAMISSINPYGTGAFKEECFKPQNVVVPMGYWNHPAKGQGRKWCVDTTGQYTNSKGKAFWWSPYIQNEIFGRGIDVRSSILPNEMIDFGGGQNTVFDPNVLANMIANAGYSPVTYSGDIRHKLSGYERDESLRGREVKNIVFDENGPKTLRLWCSLVNGRPMQDTTYVMGADVSNGLSSSNSVITIIDTMLSRRVGTWTSSSTDPAELSRVLVMLALWFGGRNGSATIAWERNGPGQIVGKYLRELSAPRLWGGEDGELGWHSTRETKRKLAEELRIAYERARFVDWDAMVLQEANDWIYGPSGSVGPSVMRKETDAAATHGDRVVSTMLAWHVCEQVQRGTPLPKPNRNDPELKALDKMARKKRTGQYTLLGKGTL